MFTKQITTIAGSLVVLMLGACGTTGTSTYPSATTTPTTSTASTYPANSASSNVTAGYGVVQGIDMIPRQSAGLGVGTVAGAVVGGVLGHQIGSGRGNTAATIAGAAGGALAGRAIQNNTQQVSDVYRVTLRMDDGTLQTLMQESQPSLRIGDRIRINNGVIERL